MPSRIQIRRDSAAAWTDADPVLALGEFGFESDSGRLKIGDGEARWTALAYAMDAPYTRAEKQKLAGIAEDAQANPPHVTAPEKDAGSATEVRSFAPADVREMVVRHAPAAPVASVAGKSGAVALDAADIAETEGRKWLDAGERTKLQRLPEDAQANPPHVTAPEKDAGSATEVRGFAPADVREMVVRHAPAAPVASVAGKSGAVALDAADIAETEGRKWLTAEERLRIGTLAGGTALPQVTAEEKARGDETGLRSYAPADVRAMILAHAASAGATPKVIRVRGQDDGGDNDRIDAALLAAQREGRATVVLEGKFRISRTVVPPSMDFLRVIGYGAELYKPDATSEYTLIKRSSNPNPLLRSDQTLILQGLTLRGDWQIRQAQAGNECRAVYVRGYGYVLFQDLTVTDISQMGLTAEYCDEVDYLGVRMARIARDAMNPSNCGEVRVVNCRAKYVYDDFLGCNITNAIVGTPGIGNSVIAVGNRFTQSHGFKIIGWRNVIISQNQSKAARLYFAEIGKDVSNNEGDRDLQNIVVTDNVALDTLPHSICRLLKGGTDDNLGIIDTDILITAGDRNLRRCVIERNVLSSETSGVNVPFSSLRLGSGYLDCSDHRLFGKTGFHDPVITLETGFQKAIRITCANAADQDAIRVGRNVVFGKSEEEGVNRTAPLYRSTAADWVIGSTEAEFRAGGSLQRLDWPGTLEAYGKCRLQIAVGTSKGFAGSKIRLQYSIDGGSSWSSCSEHTVDGASNAYYGRYFVIPDVLRYALNPVFRVVGTAGDGATPLTVLGLHLRVAHPGAVDLTDRPQPVSPAEKGECTLLAPRTFSPKDIADIAAVHGDRPVQISPEEKIARDGTALRSFSPKDVADIAVAAEERLRVLTTSGIVAPCRHLALGEGVRLLHLPDPVATGINQVSVLNQSGVVATVRAYPHARGARFDGATTIKWEPSRCGLPATYDEYTFFCVLRRGAASGQICLLSHYLANNGQHEIGFDGSASGRFSVSARNAAGDLILDKRTPWTLMNDTEMHTVLVSCRLSGTPVIQLFVDDVARDFNASGGFIDTLTAGSTIAFEASQVAVGGRSTIGQMVAADTDLFCLWFAAGPGSFLDLSVAANRRKFISAANEVMPLGRRGERPLAAPPAMFLNGMGADFAVNLAPASPVTGTVSGVLTTPSAFPAGGPRIINQAGTSLGEQVPVANGTLRAFTVRDEPAQNWQMFGE